ncbi:Response regulator of zinc sigma-54-dependent two-component system [Labilithrix luteola]|uniref:Response regulator of zinc sigma-54-dependent two-component system n=1 Tax=Labilithrix luteola TaxID=1391654 RepID=A0A0K1Q1A1_9BACT|nr:sigma 54-interacting transcriptional regulator [Labilithrix luteola]AKU99558.1 Response regulator of zinc sigma-54-dependent two-component system [Labilithrix luteola]
MTQGSTRARVLHWFVRGGVAKTASGRQIVIDVDPIVVGRDEGAHLRFDDPEVSATHCELRAVNDGVLVRDLGSTNGTFAGTLRVREAVITTPTEILVGGSRFTIEPTGKQRVEVGFADRFGDLVGASPRMRRVFGVLEKVARTPLSILILGETGTGKEIVAKSVHLASERKAGPFVVLDCGSIPASLAESILFGHEKGAFTGATERKKGALAEANGGTLFLDELGELPIDLQPKLLRALAERQVKRVGGSTFEPIDVRVLAATRRDLAVEMNAGRFRSDLFFRIAQVRVELPPLRERLDDLPLLVEDVCKRVGSASAAPTVAKWIEQRLGSYDWPGNVRELVNVVQVAATLADTPDAIDDVLTLARETGDGGQEKAQTAFAEAKRGAVAAFERDYFTQLARIAKGNVSEMARKSGMERHHVRAYLRKYGIEKG